MRTLIALIAFACIAFQTNAQTIKIGYADPDYILSELPEAKQVDSELKTLEAQLKNQIDEKIKIFQDKLAKYQAGAATMIDAVRQNEERELQQMQQNLEKLQQDARTNIQNKQVALMQPLYAKIAKAVDDVVKEGGYSLILSSQVGGLDVVLGGDEKLDLSDTILKKMGVTPKPQTATSPNTPK